jgi:hypothetical protein
VTPAGARGTAAGLLVEADGVGEVVADGLTETVALGLTVALTLVLGETLTLALGETLGLALGETLGLALGETLGLALGETLGLALALADTLELTETLGLAETLEEVLTLGDADDVAESDTDDESLGQVVIDDGVSDGDGDGSTEVALGDASAELTLGDGESELTLGDGAAELALADMDDDGQTSDAVTNALRLASATRLNPPSRISSVPVTITNSEISGRSQPLCIPRYIRCVPTVSRTRTRPIGEAAAHSRYCRHFSPTRLSPKNAGNCPGMMRQH